jgi:DNA-binding CsgD family transcriptional regulator
MTTKSCSAAAVRARAVGTAQLIRRLVAQTASSPSSPSTVGSKPGNQDLLFEDEVDGVRCLLIRVVPKEKPSVNLSPREQEIVGMIAKGYPNKTIADFLEISTWTVGTHLRRIFAKFHVNSRAAMVARAAAIGMFPTAPRASTSSPHDSHRHTTRRSSR